MISVEILLSSLCRTSCWRYLLAQAGRCGDGGYLVEMASVHELSLRCMGGWVVGGWVSEWVGGADGWMDRRTHRWMGEWRRRGTGGWADERKDEWRDEWMDTWADG